MCVQAPAVYWPGEACGVPDARNGAEACRGGN